MCWLLPSTGTRQKKRQQPCGTCHPGLQACGCLSTFWHFPFCLFEFKAFIAPSTSLPCITRWRAGRLGWGKGSSVRWLAPVCWEGAGPGPVAQDSCHVTVFVSFKFFLFSVSNCVSPLSPSPKFSLGVQEEGGLIYQEKPHLLSMWHMPAFLSLEKRMQEDYKFEANPNNILSSRPAWDM